MIFYSLFWFYWRKRCRQAQLFLQWPMLRHVSYNCGEDFINESPGAGKLDVALALVVSGVSAPDPVRRRVGDSPQWKSERGWTLLRIFIFFVAGRDRPEAEREHRRRNVHFCLFVNGDTRLPVRYCRPRRNIYVFVTHVWTGFPGNLTGGFGNEFVFSTFGILIDTLHGIDNNNSYSECSLYIERSNEKKNKCEDQRTGAVRPEARRRADRNRKHGRLKSETRSKSRFSFYSVFVTDFPSDFAPLRRSHFRRGRGSLQSSRLVQPWTVQL